MSGESCRFETGEGVETENAGVRVNKRVREKTHKDRIGTVPFETRFNRLHSEPPGLDG